MDCSSFHRCSDTNPATPTSCVDVKDHATGTRTDHVGHSPFLGNLLSLPEIETLWVDKNETDTTTHKRLKTDNMDQGCANKITEGKLVIALCESRVLSVQAFLKDLKVHSSQMAWFIGEQLGELEQLKRVFDKM